jgi:hypothetical protein
MNKKFSNSQILEIKHRFESPKLTPFRISNLRIFNLHCLIALKSDEVRKNVPTFNHPPKTTPPCKEDMQGGVFVSTLKRIRG